MTDKNLRKKKQKSTLTTRQRQGDPKATDSATPARLSDDSITTRSEVEMETRRQAIHEANLAELAREGKNHPALIAAYLEGAACGAKMAKLVGADEATIDAALGPPGQLSIEEVQQVIQGLTEEGEIDEATAFRLLASLEELLGGETKL